MYAGRDKQLNLPVGDAGRKAVDDESKSPQESQGAISKWEQLRELVRCGKADPTPIISRP